MNLNELDNDAIKKLEYDAINIIRNNDEEWAGILIDLADKVGLSGIELFVFMVSLPSPDKEKIKTELIITKEEIISNLETKLLKTEEELNEDNRKAEVNQEIRSREINIRADIFPSLDKNNTKNERLTDRDTYFSGKLTSVYRKFGLAGRSPGKLKELYLLVKAEHDKIKEDKYNPEKLWQRLCELAGDPTTKEMGLELLSLEPSEAMKRKDRKIDYYDINEKIYPDTITIDRKYKFIIHFPEPAWLILLIKDPLNYIDSIVPSEKNQAKIYHVCDGICKIPEEKNIWLGSKEVGKNELWALVIPKSVHHNQKVSDLLTNIKKLFEDKNHVMALQEILKFAEEKENVQYGRITLRANYNIK